LVADKVRTTPHGPRYDHPSVRIAAARALGSLLTRISNDDIEIEGEGAQSRQVQSIFDDLRWDQRFIRLLQAWSNVADGRTEQQEFGRSELGAILQDGFSDTLERTIAAFALGDLAYEEDARLLLSIMLSTPLFPQGTAGDAGTLNEWNDIVWAAADALTLFDAEHVARLLAELFSDESAMMIPDTSIQQVAYVAGRVRSQDRALIGWLVELLIRHPDYQVKAKALQALAMQGQALETFAWLEALLKSMAAHPHATPGTLRQCIQDIAAWRNARLQTWGFKDTLTEQPDAVLYLRGKAVEALEWIGTQQTLDDLSPEVPDWPLELRGVWHFTAMAIQRRLQPVG
jgi:hypothetical protein